MTKEERKEYDRQYYEVHKEKKKAYDREYYLKNKEKVLKQRREYYAAHREKRKEQMREYRNTPLGRAKEMVSSFEKEDKKRGRGDCTIDEQWILKNIFTSKCFYCGESDWHKLGCDRINNDLPHTPENVVCCCGSCNNKRGTIPFKEFVQRLKNGETLLKKNRPDRSKPVVAKDKDGNIVCWFPSTREAGRNGYDQSSVSDCCRGKLKTYKDLYWQYE